MEPSFEGACVLLTGASGCVGKPLLAKMLLGRVGLPRKIYLILRAKNGKPAQDRVAELLDSPVFDTHELEMGREGLLRLASDRVVALDGDLSAEGLGLSDEHRRQVISDCEVVISCAAAVGFNEKLSFARNANTRGALRMLQLARECHACRPGGVSAFVHVSTAYVNVDRAGGSVIQEKLYEPPLPVTDFMQMSDDELDARSDELTNYTPACESAEGPARGMTGFPNTYSFSKRMAEHALDQEAAAGIGFPIAIVRPAIIGCSVAEPKPGWTDSLLGTGSVMLAAGLGMIHAFPMQGGMLHDLVPLDTVVDAILATIVCARDLRPCEGNSVPVVNASSSRVNPLTITEVCEATNMYWAAHPPKTRRQLRTPNWHASSVQEWERDVKAMSWKASLLSKLPILSKSGRALQKGIRQTHKLDGFFRPFTNNEWCYDATNLLALPSLLKARGEPVGQYSALHLDKLAWEPYLDLMCYGLRHYILKEKDSVWTFDSDAVMLGKAGGRKLRAPDAVSPIETGGRKHRIADSFAGILISINLMLAVFVMLFTRAFSTGWIGVDRRGASHQPTVVDWTVTEFYVYVAVGVAMSLEFFYFFVFRGMERPGKSGLDKCSGPLEPSADDEPLSPQSPFSPTTLRARPVRRRAPLSSRPN